MNLTKQEEHSLKEKFPGIDLEFVKYYLKSFTFTEICRKVARSKIYPVAPVFPGIVQERNYKLLKIIDITKGNSKEIKKLIVNGKSIYDILDIELQKSQETDVSLFKSKEYMKEAENLLLKEFGKESWAFKIVEILKTENSYVKARKKLLKRKRNFLEKLYFQMFSIFYNRNSEELCSFYVDLENSELKKEILEEISKQDEKLATLINNDQYLNLKEEIQCGCCFQGTSWEELGSCRGGHLFCKDCILSLVRECTYGAGKMRGDTVKCVDIDGNCQEEILNLERFVPKTVLETYYSLMALKEIKKAGIKLLKCPFCSYAEEDTHSDSLVTIGKRWISRIITYDRVKTFLPIAMFLISFLLTSYFQGSARNLYYSLFLSAYLKKKLDLLDLKRIVHKIHCLLKEKYAIFNCKKCLKASCVNCLREWEVDHECHEKEKYSFRLFVEKKMSEALLRTCPKCKISFSKSDGCNKITCPQCKYSMCFICRADIRREKYSHFCNVSLKLFTN